jgi:hypothetical protein
MVTEKFEKLCSPARKVAFEVFWSGGKIIEVYPPNTIVIETPSGETKSLHITKDNFSEIMTAFEIGYELAKAKACEKKPAE